MIPLGIPPNFFKNVIYTDLSRNYCRNSFMKANKNSFRNAFIVSTRNSTRVFFLEILSRSHPDISLRTYSKLLQKSFTMSSMSQLRNLFFSGGAPAKKKLKGFSRSSTRHSLSNFSRDSLEDFFKTFKVFFPEIPLRTHYLRKSLMDPLKIFSRNTLEKSLRDLFGNFRQGYLKKYLLRFHQS